MSVGEAHRLDTAGPGSETGATSSQEGAAGAAVGILARTAAKPRQRQETADIAAKAVAVARRVAELREDAAVARRLACETQAQEAMTRTALAQALIQACARGAAIMGEVRALALRSYFAPAEPPRRSLRRRLARRLARPFTRFGSLGGALVLAASPAWRKRGRALWDLRHMAAYVRRGADPSVTPPSAFDQAWYLRRYPDVGHRRMAPLLHYLAAGAGEGRDPHPLFDSRYYAQQNADALAANRLLPLEHFVSFGAWTGRDPHPLFDMAHYAAQAPDPAAGEDLLSHYLRVGWRLGLSPHPLFDPGWYAEQVRADGPPLVHYLAVGAAKGLSPHPLVELRWYRKQHPDVADMGVDPLQHFLLRGAAEGRSPSPRFDLPHYVAVRGAALAAGVNPLIDYLQGGAWSVSEPTPGFATAAYVAAHPDLVETGLTPLEHWARRRRS